MGQFIIKYHKLALNKKSKARMRTIHLHYEDDKTQTSIIHLYEKITHGAYEPST